MDVLTIGRRLRSPEECVALLKYKAAATIMAGASVGIVAVMLALVWRVMSR